MIDRSLRRQFLIFLAIAVCLSMSLQSAPHLSYTEPIADSLRCVEASLVTASTLPKDTAGEGPSCDECSSAESLSAVWGLPSTELSQQRRALVTDRTCLAEGYSAEIYRPPIPIV